MNKERAQASVKIRFTKKLAHKALKKPKILKNISKRRNLKWNLNLKEMKIVGMQNYLLTAIFIIFEY